MIVRYVHIFDSIILNTFFQSKWWRLSMISWNLVDMTLVLNNNQNMEWLKAFHLSPSVATKSGALACSSPCANVPLECVEFFIFLSDWVVHLPLQYRIGGVKVSVIASSVVDRGFESRWGQAKDYEIGVCCFSAKHTAALRRKGKDLYARNQDDISEWCDMFIRGLLLQWASTMQIQLTVLV